MAKVISYDLGTGGTKASLYDEDGNSLATSFIQYDTIYPKDKWHEQRPMDWWDSVCESTRVLLEKSGVAPGEIEALALSGQSLVTVPLSASKELLMDKVPIWSDTRATDQLDSFFNKIPYEKWYMTTGNGFPAECYSIFKLMWMRENLPDIYEKTEYILGSKDFVNYMFTGEMATDPSYASGSGFFDLNGWKFSDEFFETAGIKKSLFPKIVPSNAVVGTVTAKAARESGLVEGTKVACGGVDNSCMALGARGVGEGRVYTSLGSSSWIPVTSKKPILDVNMRPYVFAHIEEGYYTSATSIFAGGSSFRWVRDNLCRDVLDMEDPYIAMNEWAAKVPIGSNGLLFNPSLAGGTSQDKSINIRGAYIGLALGNTREDMVRAAMEGIALNLRVVLDSLKKHAKIDNEMLLCGGGSKSPLWRQIFADVYNLKIVKTNIDQDAASLGAAAVAAVAAGIWKDYSIIDKLHIIESVEMPDPANNKKYEELLKVFTQASGFLSDIGDRMQEING